MFNPAKIIDNCQSTEPIYSSGYIYIIKNMINNKLYIGQTMNHPKTRLRKHVCTGKTKIGKALKKYGLQNFNLYFLPVPEDSLDAIEMSLIAYFDSVNKGYNIELGGNKNKRLNPDTKRKISNSLKGHVVSEETREKIRVKNTGKKKSADEIEKIRLRFTGRKISEETKAKISRARKGVPSGRIGYKHSEETIAKMSATRKNNPMRGWLGRSHTEEQRERIRKALLGHSVSEETREKIRVKNLGLIMSEETKLKISKANKGKHSKFTASEIEAIRNDSRHKIDIAKSYGVHRKTIERIKKSTQLSFTL